MADPRYEGWPAGRSAGASGIPGAPFEGV